MFPSLICFTIYIHNFFNKKRSKVKTREKISQEKPKQAITTLKTIEINRNKAIQSNSKSKIQSIAMFQKL